MIFTNDQILFVLVLSFTIIFQVVEGKSISQDEQLMINNTLDKHKGEFAF